MEKTKQISCKVCLLSHKFLATYLCYNYYWSKLGNIMHLCVYAFHHLPEIFHDNVQVITQYIHLLSCSLQPLILYEAVKIECTGSIVGVMNRQ